MHVTSLNRMSWFVKEFAQPSNGVKLKVLDVGSYDVNGSYKRFFPADKYDYTGLDIDKGPNVDIVLDNPYDWSGVKSDEYDVVISGQAFEHTEFFWLTIAEMTRVLKNGGIMCIIAPLGFEEHRYPVDCYRFYTDGMVAMARYVSLDVLHAHTNAGPQGASKDWFSEREADSVLIAKKSYSGPARIVDVKTYKCIPPDHETLRKPLQSYQPKNRLVRYLIRKLSQIE